MSVLDRIVPGYYHRLSATGAVETSTCCANTATEHAMMEKLMVDSVVTWARDYKVDGFRFDLMGHQPKAAMLDRAPRAGRAHARAGRGRRESGSTSTARAGTSARWRAARGSSRRRRRTWPAPGSGRSPTGCATPSAGGGPFDDDPRVQGFATGLSTDPNGAPVNGSAAQQRERLLLAQDLIKVGLAGNLRDFRFIDRPARWSTAARSTTTARRRATPPIRGRRSPTSTRTTTRRCSTRCSSSCRTATSMADRVRMNTLALVH